MIVNISAPIDNNDGRSSLPAGVSGKEVTRIQSYILLALSDFLAVVAAFLFANVVYTWDPSNRHGVAMLSVIVPIYFGIASLNGAYGGRVLEDVKIGIAHSVQAICFAAASVLLIIYFLKSSAEFSRAIFGIGMGSCIILLVLSRYLIRGAVLRLLGGTPYATVVITDGVPFAAQPFDIVLTAEQLRFQPDTKDPISYHALALAVAGADRVIVACPKDRFANWSSVLKGMAIDGEILTDDDDPLGIIGIGSHAGRRTMVVAAGPLHLRDRTLKRLLDITLSGIGLIILSPVLIAVAVAIKLESRGAVFFVQSRIGRDNKLFKMYKFRSMYSEMCDQNASLLTSRNDSRVTRVGDFIRRTSIDELPQLINVLKGNMSVVGPRPHALSAKAADLLYWDVDPRYRHRHSIKPGLTGLAQVRGFRGNTERTEDLTNRLRSDLEYASNWSIWRDLQIIGQTFVVLRHQNAF